MNRNRSLLTAIAALAMCVLATSAFATKYSALIQSYGSHTIAYWQFEEPAGTSYAFATVPAGQPVTSPPAGSDAFRYINVPTTAEFTKVPGAGIDGAGIAVGTGGNAELQQIYGTGGTAITNFKPASFTVEWWAKPTDASSIFTPSSTGTFSAGLGTLGKPIIGLVDGNGVHRLAPEDIGGSAPALNQWNFFVFTWQDNNDGSGTAKYYINGEERVFTGSTPGKLFTGLQLPVDRPAWSQFEVDASASSAALLDELAIFNVALTQQQILDQLYAVPEPGLLSLLALGGAFLVWRRKVAAKRA